MTVDSELEQCARCVDKFKKMEISELFVVVIGALFADKYLAECSIVGYKYFQYWIEGKAKHTYWSTSIWKAAISHSVQKRKEKLSSLFSIKLKAKLAVSSKF